MTVGDKGRRALAITIIPIIGSLEIQLWKKNQLLRTADSMTETKVL